MTLSLRDLKVVHGGSAILDGVSLDLEPGSLTAIIGPNGAGKTSLLRAALGLEEARGKRHVGGRDLSTLTPAEQARKIAYLPQKRPIAWPIEVRDVVALGRFAYGGPAGSLRERDAAAVARAMAACGLEPLARRETATLSGGEETLVHVARALAGETPYLLADEPAAALDPAHQHQVMGLLRAYAQGGGGALVVLHDLSLALQYADRIVAMKAGQVVADGHPESALTPSLIHTLFGIDAEITPKGVHILPPKRGS